jgi:putative ABC transport system permease protein
MVTASYHATFGIDILRGRTFADTDRAGSSPVAIVNEEFAKRFLADRDPVGQRVLMAPFAFGVPGSQGPPPIEWEIVGVQANAANAGPGRPPFPEVIVPFAQNPWPSAIVAVRTSSGIATPIAEIAGILGTIDATLPMARIQTIEQTLTQSTATDRFYTVFFAAFAGLALVLAAVGIYGVMSFAVAQRTHEIGLRMALGGGRTQVLKQILREGMATSLAGTALGAIGAALIGRALEGTVYGVEPGNPFTFVAVVVTLLTAALVACLVPARRAAAVDPMVALRHE